jgi:hypothetical protein
LDQRATIIDLTPLGQFLHSEYTGKATKFSRALEDAISVEDRDVLDKCLTKLAHWSKELTSMTPYDHHIMITTSLEG